MPRRLSMLGASVMSIRDAERAVFIKKKERCSVDMAKSIMGNDAS
jgi:hypothetical protein